MTQSIDISTSHVGERTNVHLAAAEAAITPNYAPLPVVLASGEGAWVTDVDGRRYLDALAGYSALNFGHRHPGLTAVAHEQLDTLTLTSRAFHSDRLADFCTELAALCGKEMVLPMNTGAEAVESGIKVARRWGSLRKGVTPEHSKIIVMDGNFHGRTTTIVGFSTDPDAREHFGPFTPGFQVVPYGDATALEAAIDEHTVAVLVEPIQGEGGVIIPPADFLPTVRRLCTEHQVLMIADEIQSGLGRTGRLFACDHVDVVPDMYLLGKALGGGILPVSAVVADRDVLGVLTPGSHGSTFGGNPFSAAVGLAVVRLLATGEFQNRASELEPVMREGLDKLVGHGVENYRLVGLWAGVDIDPALMTGKQAAKRMAQEGVLVKETHGSTIRLAPPLVVTAEEVRLITDTLKKVLTDAAVTSEQN
ncbi:ornithine--oxo-acid transaminase [Dermatophilus congolensis]|uniref:ornithine--oxo-acid transaminase n=1 Tax=Dermatophilus congolensis TaxID=1863 RepID=UPI001AAED3EA|nr:ornithine--oxo-acid transaminase [Dermatophilus congolensis]MBO3142600.1 ornithine--oxo-acid transaminase [Dermatophilus congolensis]MBO3151588.1 ornithine--oxo-acid transaminase [Dermatophilus congolensis]MBO3161409.1 ornithine--oxo-acid transaminase [Dermatophilus congolensis]MBO3162873.1 ornithine--oxo-acid transaminase [Dermatophilus congolensis]MBO3176427.1 ornithine--oxo-acid transaminase [Dermatophilus congolensis]